MVSFVLFGGTLSVTLFVFRCVAVHRERRLMYDARLCLRRLLTPSESMRAAQGQSTNHPLNTTDLVSGCLLPVQPLDLLAVSRPLSSAYTVGAQRLNSIQALELTTSWNVETVAQVQQEEHISHILDWWPDDQVLMPVGYHVTAPMLQNELAPVGFDSHYAYDPSDSSIHYVHSGLRNASLLGEYLGAGGVCRCVFCTHSSIALLIPCAQVSFHRNAVVECKHKQDLHPGSPLPGHPAFASGSAQELALSYGTVRARLSQSVLWSSDVRLQCP